MTQAELFEEFKAEFKRRKFSAGLLIAMIDFLENVGAYGKGYKDLKAFLKDHPQQDTTRGKKAANTLIVLYKGEPLSLRPFYNTAERFFRAESKRFDYPNCAPHATQAWSDKRFTAWLESLLGFTKGQATKLKEDVKAFVLAELPTQAPDTSGLKPLARRFTALLERFDTAAQKGEPPGSVFQGMVYAYIRADAPHLHLEVSKVGAGSKRLQRVGDIDGWEGERLVLSAEVKAYRLAKSDEPEVAGFCDEVKKRKALGIVAAFSFEEELEDSLRVQDIRPLDLEGMLRLVDLWDPLKQQAAVAAFTYYVHHIEKNSALIKRLKTFLDELVKEEEGSLAAGAPSTPPVPPPSPTPPSTSATSTSPTTPTKAKPSS